MRVLRGRADSLDADRERTASLLTWASDHELPALRVWCPHRQVAFGRRDTSEPGYQRAKAVAEARGYPAVERAVGGRAVAFTGSIVAVVYAAPDADRTAIQDRYDHVSERLRVALSELGVEARTGEPDDSFCPGSHSLQTSGKIAGLGQRVRRTGTITAGVVIVRDHETVAEILAQVYAALEVPFDPDSVGSLARADGVSEPETVCDAIAAAFST